MQDLEPALVRLADRQRGAVHRDQLRDLDVSRSRVAHQLRSGRWTAVGRQVVVLGAGTGAVAANRPQLMWIALLDAGLRSVLGSHTALELAGFRSFAKEAGDLHLVVARGARVTPLPGVVVHESRRLDVADHALTRGCGRPGHHGPRSMRRRGSPGPASPAPCWRPSCSSGSAPPGSSTNAWPQWDG